MKITVHVRLRSKSETIVQTGDNEYIVSVKARPVNGKANAAVIRVLAKHLGVPCSSLRITHGKSSRNKVISRIIQNRT